MTNKRERLKYLAEKLSRERDTFRWSKEALELEPNFSEEEIEFISLCDPLTIYDLLKELSVK